MQQARLVSSKLARYMLEQYEVVLEPQSFDDLISKVAGETGTTVDQLLRAVEAAKKDVQPASEDDLFPDPAPALMNDANFGFYGPTIRAQSASLFDPRRDATMLQRAIKKKSMRMVAGVLARRSQRQRVAIATVFQAMFQSDLEDELLQAWSNRSGQFEASAANSSAEISQIQRSATLSMVLSTAQLLARLLKSVLKEESTLPTVCRLSLTANQRVDGDIEVEYSIVQGNLQEEILSCVRRASDCIGDTVVREWATCLFVRLTGQRPHETHVTKREINTTLEQLRQCRRDNPHDVSWVFQFLLTEKSYTFLRCLDRALGGESVSVILASLPKNVPAILVDYVRELILMARSPLALWTRWFTDIFRLRAENKHQDWQINVLSALTVWRAEIDLALISRQVTKETGRSVAQWCAIWDASDSIELRKLSTIGESSSRSDSLSTVNSVEIQSLTPAELIRGGFVPNHSESDPSHSSDEFESQSDLLSGSTEDTGTDSETRDFAALLRRASLLNQHTFSRSGASSFSRAQTIGSVDEPSDTYVDSDELLN
ncbi:MAG: hypothetical protein MHM6MM_005255 [Cercozoa sp. M6MM]